MSSALCAAPVRAPVPCEDRRGVAPVKPGGRPVRGEDFRSLMFEACLNPGSCGIQDHPADEVRSERTPANPEERADPAEQEDGSPKRAEVGETGFLAVGETGSAVRCGSTASSGIILIPAGTPEMPCSELRLGAAAAAGVVESGGAEAIGSGLHPRRPPGCAHSSEVGFGPDVGLLDTPSEGGTSTSVGRGPLREHAGWGVSFQEEAANSGAQAGPSRPGAGDSGQGAQTINDFLQNPGSAGAGPGDAGARSGGGIPHAGVSNVEPGLRGEGALEGSDGVEKGLLQSRKTADFAGGGWQRKVASPGAVEGKPGRRLVGIQTGQEHDSTRTGLGLGIAGELAGRSGGTPDLSGPGGDEFLTVASGHGEPSHSLSGAGTLDKVRVEHLSQEPWNQGMGTSPYSARAPGLDGVISNGQQVYGKWSQRVAVDGENFTDAVVRFASIRLRDRDWAEMAISLKPENLGEVKIRISVEAGTLSASFSVTNGLAKELVEGSLAQLRYALSSTGFNVGGLAVWVGGREGGYRPSARGEETGPAGTPLSVAETAGDHLEPTEPSVYVLSPGSSFEWVI